MGVLGFTARALSRNVIRGLGLSSRMARPFGRIAGTRLLGRSAMGRTALAALALLGRASPLGRAIMAAELAHAAWLWRKDVLRRRAEARRAAWRRRHHARIRRERLTQSQTPLPE